MRLPTLVTAFVLVSSACGGCADEQSVDGTAWQFNREPDAGSEPTDTNQTQPPDLATAPDLPPDMRPPPTTNLCPPVTPEVWIDEGQVFDRPTRSISIAGDSMWFVRSEAGRGKALYRRRNFRSEAEYIRNIDALLDADAAGILLIVEGSVVLYDPNREADRVLAPANVVRDWDWAPFESAAYRLVDRDVVTWVTDGVYRARDADISTLARPSGRLPYARNGAVAFVDDAGAVAIDGSDGLVSLGVQAGPNVALSNSNLWFREPAGFMARVPLRSLDDRSVTEVRPPGTRGCDSLAVSTDGWEVAASCVQDDGTEALFYSADGDEWRRVVELGGPIQQTFAVGFGWVVYADFARERPVIVAVPPDPSAPPVELGEVQQACLSCGAYWSPNYIEFENGLVAWNYARLEGEDFEAERVGMARVCVIPR